MRLTLFDRRRDADHAGNGRRERARWRCRSWSSAESTVTAAVRGERPAGRGELDGRAVRRGLTVHGHRRGDDDRCESTTGLAFDAVSVTLVPVGGVRSAAAAAARRRSRGRLAFARREQEKKRQQRHPRFLLSHCLHVSPLSTTRRAMRAACLGAPSAVKAELERERGRVEHVVSGQRLAEDFQDHFQLHDRTSRLRIASAVLRLQRGKRRLRERVRLEHREVRASPTTPTPISVSIERTNDGGTSVPPSVRRYETR